MKTTRAIAILLLLLFGPMAAAQAHGHWGGGHHYWGPRWGVSVGIGVGAPWPYYYPYSYYPYGYYAYPPVVVTQPAPTTYIQQDSPAPAPVQQPRRTNDWYYCHDPEGYYPYVKSCPNGWQRVPATPPQN